ncbi:MAG: exopolysaccharide biosynthesis protein [Acidimicrobiales bacterium]
MSPLVTDERPTGRRSEGADPAPSDRDAAGDRLSVQLEEWLGDGRAKTIGGLVARFGPHSFAVVFVLLMALPALPLPTGGVTHVLEVAAMLLALELLAGRREIWLPARWHDKAVPALSSPRFQRALLGRVRWCERWSRPRMAHLLEHGLVRRLYGLVILALALVAFVAPPFSGLDTLPALGAVVLSLGVLLGDVVVAMVGVAIGAVGTALVIGLARAITHLLW